MSQKMLHKKLISPFNVGTTHFYQNLNEQISLKIALELQRQIYSLNLQLFSKEDLLDE
jgi:hypothetical protein